MIIITGANGLVGSFFLSGLNAMGIKAKGLVREKSYIPASIRNYDLQTYDLFDTLALEDIFEGSEQVIHTAGHISFDPMHKDTLYRVNVEGTKNVVNACLSSGVRKLVFFSSVGAIGKNPESVTSNEDTQWSQKDSKTYYGMSKYLGELEVWRGAQEGLDVMVFCPSVIFGPYPKAHSSTRLFHYVNGQNRFFPDGKFNYVDIRDIFIAYKELVSQNIWNNRLIINGGWISFGEFFQLCANIKGKKPPKHRLGYRAIYTISLIERLFHMLFRKSPVISPDLSSVIKSPTYYDSASLLRLLAGFTFHKIEETINWVNKEWQKDGEE